MNTTLVATLGGLGAALCWGTGDWLSARASKHMTPFQVNFTVEVGGTVIALLLLLTSGLHMPAAKELVEIVAAAIFITAGYTTFVRALAAGATGVIVPLSNSFPIITTVFAVYFLDQVFSAGKFVGMFVVLLGAALLAYEKNKQNIPIRELHKDTLLAVIAALLWGVGFFLLDPVTTKVPWQTTTILIQAVMLPLSIIMLLVAERSRFIPAAKQALRHKSVWVVGMAGTIGGACLYLGSGRAGSIVIPAVLTACGPLVTAVLSAVVDHERLGVLKRVGAVCVVLGIVILNLA